MYTPTRRTTPPTHGPSHTTIPAGYTSTRRTAALAALKDTGKLVQFEPDPQLAPLKDTGQRVQDAADRGASR